MCHPQRILIRSPKGPRQDQVSKVVDWSRQRAPHGCKYCALSTTFYSTNSAALRKSWAHNLL